MTDTALTAAPLGSRCVVTALGGGGAMRRRLMDLGLVEGTEISPLFESIFKNPRAYHIRGAMIALRSEDTDLIRVNILQ